MRSNVQQKHLLSIPTGWIYCNYLCVLCSGANCFHPHGGEARSENGQAGIAVQTGSVVLCSFFLGKSEESHPNPKTWLTCAQIPLLSTFYFGLTTRSSNSIQVRNPITTSAPVATTTTTTDDTQFEQYIPFMVTLILCISLGIVMICKVAAPGSGNAAPLSGNYKRI